MPASPRSAFEYAIVRVVPRIERGECFNVGIVLYCRPRRFLGARIHLDPAKLAALAPNLRASEVQPHLDAIARICSGDRTAGPIARLSQSERFHWLVAPSSTIIQPSEVHGGLTDDPAATLEHSFATLVAGPAPT